MNNIIFLDIDGVLNYKDFFKEMKSIRVNYSKYLNDDVTKKILIKLLDIDYNKLNLLKELIDETNSSVVITSSWRNLTIYPFLEEYLINMGIPIIDTTKYLDGRREIEIKEYFYTHEVDNYLIIDDDLFKTYDEELFSHFIHTNFYHNGLTENDVYEGIYKLKKKL